MLKKHLAVMLLFVVAAGVFSQSIPSGTGRYEALGNSPFILDAATDINNNPAWSNYYRDYSFGDIGRNTDGEGSAFELSDQYAGVSFGVTKKLALGVIVNKTNDGWSTFGGNATNLGINSPIVPTTVLIGYSLNKNFHLGLAPYVAMWKRNYESSDTNSADTNRSSRSLGANLGVMYNMKKGWIEGVIHFRMNKYESETITSSTTTTADNDGGLEIGVALRGWFNTKSKTAVVPVLGFMMYGFTPKTVSGSTTTLGPEYTFMNISGGVGLNIPITDDIQIAGGVVAEYNTFKASFTGDSLNPTTEFKRNDLVAPRFHMAGETRIADWLTARFGFNRAITMRSDESSSTLGGSTTTTNVDELLPSNSVQTVSLGAGFHFGRFSIDATVSERWLKQGINFVSGTSNELFGVVSASYNFAK
jgi:hypothetical protein